MKQKCIMHNQNVVYKNLTMINKNHLQTTLSKIAGRKLITGKQ
jgi:hypothetical protein